MSVKSPEPETSAKVRVLPPLNCEEDLGRTSPLLWPPKTPGTYDIAKKYVEEVEHKVNENISIDSDDLVLMSEIGKLSPDQLMHHIRKMQHAACYLGLLEEMEHRRGLLVRVLNREYEDEKSKQYFAKRMNNAKRAQFYRKLSLMRYLKRGPYSLQSADREITDLTNDNQETIVQNGEADSTEHQAQSKEEAQVEPIDAQEAQAE